MSQGAAVLSKNSVAMESSMAVSKHLGVALSQGTAGDCMSSCVYHFSFGVDVEVPE
jgi:hypothetical protein